MLDKKTVFILGAGASCPYGFPSGAHLREYICLSEKRPKEDELKQALESEKEFVDFKKKFEDSSTKSIDLFMARNPKLAQVGKCVIAFEMFQAEHRSQFRERVEHVQEILREREYRGGFERYLMKKDFQGGDWYSYLFDRLTTGITGTANLPDFSEGKIAFITFNYDRSLEYFLYKSLRNSFLDAEESQIVQCLKSLKILHIYGQIAPLKWQNPTQGVDYRPPISAPLLRSASLNIRTIYEEEKSEQLMEARELVKAAQRIFFLGFGYAQENMSLLQLPRRIPRECSVYGTAYGLEENEIKEIRNNIIKGLLPGPGMGKNSERILIEGMDCLKLLRNYL